jgi:hypothetical protein
MRKRHNYLKQKADKRLLLRNYVFQALIFLLFLIVLYDSFIHKTPFYYICFLLLGLFIGKVLSIADRVKQSEEDGTFTVISTPYGIIITLFLLSFRFFWGRQILDFANVLYATDALYLLFIGIYWSKWKSTLRQMDEIIYGWLSNKEDSSNIS